MTDVVSRSDPTRSRWLPALVFSLFAAIILADAVVVALYGNYRNIIEDNGLEVVFTPVDETGGGVEGVEIDAVEGARAVADDGAVLVAVTGGRFHVRAPGTLTIRFRAPDAGSWVRLDYRFGKRRSDASCELVLARVASRYGVDYMSRRTLIARKKAKGRFRHFLADHAGWFELSFRVDPAAAKIGFEAGFPEIYRN